MTAARQPPGRAVLGAVGLGSSAYCTIVVSFVFAPYLAAPWSAAADAALGLSAGPPGWASPRAAAGVLIAVLAPVTGQRADAGGRRRRSLAHLHRPGHRQHPRSVLRAGRPGLPVARSGPDGGRLGVHGVRRRLLQRDAAPDLHARDHRPDLRVRLGQRLPRRHRGAAGGVRPLHRPRGRAVRGDRSHGGSAIRALALVVAVWFAVFAIPVLLTVPEVPPTPARRRVSFLARTSS